MGAGPLSASRVWRLHLYPFMALRIDTQAEPLPGYRLIERLGRGGFGEVWKCEAPGGLHKAIKFVYGDLRSAHEGTGLAEQELKALSRVKTVRHPYILSLERFDIIEGQLIIVMELADRSLADRFRECVAGGLPGIPRAELLRYMEETAEALDLMNLNHDLQHLDIKPQNLFLVHNHVKVADFGLVKGLQGARATMTGGVTPLYAAPETFDSTVSRFCDQYSLAIVYQELLTGRRPFTGATARQLLMQHVQGTPDLSSLPANDREPIGRALAKKPEARHPSCQDLLRALRAGEGSKVVLPVRGDEGAGAAYRAETHSSPAPAVSTPFTPQAMPPAAGDMDPAIMLSPGLLRSTPIPPKSLPVTIHTQIAPAVTAEVLGDGVLFPALVIATGQAGLEVVQRMRDGLCSRFGSLHALPNLRILYLDTDPESMRAALEGGGTLALEPPEILPTRLARASHFLKPGRQHIPLDSWFDGRLLYRLPRNQSTNGARAIGRLAFMDSYCDIVSRLRSDLQACADPETLAATAQQTGLGMRTNQPRVYIVTGLAGGTGGGMFIDLAYVTRAVLRQLGFARPDVAGVFLLPGVDDESSQTPAVANTVAALTELNHFSSQRVSFQAHYDLREEPLVDSEPPFGRCVMLSMVPTTEDKGSRDWAGLAAGYLVRELTTPAGRRLDERRAKAGAGRGPLVCQTFGAYRFSCPRRVMLRRGARRLCRRLIKNWINPPALPSEDQVQAWIAQRWEQEQLTPARLLERLQQRCQRSLGKEPDALVAEIVDRFAEQSATGSDPQAAGHALRQLEQILGRPEEDATSARTAITEALDKASRRTAARWEEKITAVALGLIDEPGLRLAGAERVLPYIQAGVKDVVTAHEPLADELAAQASGVYKNLHAVLERLQGEAPGSRRASAAAAESVELMRQYTKTRYHSLVLRRAVVICRGLLARVPEYLREIGAIRTRLEELLEILRSPTATRIPEVDLGPGGHLLPSGRKDPDEVVNESLESLSDADCLEVENSLREAVRIQFKSVAQACLGPTAIFKDFEALLRAQAEKFVEARLALSDVAAMYLGRAASSQEMRADLTQAFEQAAPPLAPAQAAAPAELCVMVVPAGESGNRLGRLAAAALPGVEVVPAAAVDDVVLYREQSQLAFPSLPQLGAVARDVYRRLLETNQSPHNRLDIANWLPVE